METETHEYEMERRNYDEKQMEALEKSRANRPERVTEIPADAGIQERI